MGRNRAIEKVLEDERRYALFDQRVLGYPVWPLERLRRYHLELLDGKLVEATGPNAPLRSRLKALQAPLSQSLRDARALAFSKSFAERDLWVLGTSMYRRPDAAGVQQCIFAEDLRTQLGDRLLFLERTTNDLRTEPRADVVHLDAAHVSAMLSAKAIGAFLGKGGVVSAAQREAFAPMTPEYLCQLALYGQAMEKLAEAMIARNRPKAVFVLCGYQPFVPMQRAIRSAGIPLIELQHGVIQESHPGYVLGDGASCAHVPDHLIVFGERFAQIARNASAHWRGRITIGGHPWLRMKSQGVPPLAERGSIVVFSQADIPVRAALLEMTRALAGRLPSGLRMIVKPHPREADASEYWSELSALGVELAQPSSDSYALLRDCRVALCVHSTVAIEAIAFGCTSAVTLPSFWTDEIRAMVDAGLLHAAREPSDLLALLDAPPQETEQHAREWFAVDRGPLDYAALLRALGAV
jgi:hypothetical protein